MPEIEPFIALTDERWFRFLSSRAVNGRVDEVNFWYPKPWGGRFRPHRTHRNGLSFDFMVPLKDGRRFSGHLFNRFGYDQEFDADGRAVAGDIDFGAMIRHLTLLDHHARAAGGRVRRVFFAPDLQDDLFRATGGYELARSFRFNARPSWVRHDQHYHVDFDFPCQPA